MIDGNGYPQNVLVIGGGSEIAAAIVQLLAAGGMQRLALAGPREETMVPVQERIGPAVATRLFKLDLSEPAQVEPVIGEAAAWLGTLDCTIVASAILGDQPTDELSPELVAASLTINTVGPAAALTSVAGRVESQGFGQIIVLSSVAGEVVRRRNYLYGAGKAGLDGFALGLAERLRPRASLLVVRPGFVRSRMTAHLDPAPLATTPEQVAQDTLSALAAGRIVVWSPGLLRWVMVAFRHLPRAIARKIPL